MLLKWFCALCYINRLKKYYFLDQFLFSFSSCNGFFTIFFFFASFGRVRNWTILCYPFNTKEKKTRNKCKYICMYKRFNCFDFSMDTRVEKIRKTKIQSTMHTWLFTILKLVFYGFHHFVSIWFAGIFIAIWKIKKKIERALNNIIAKNVCSVKRKWFSSVQSEKEKEKTAMTWHTFDNFPQ